MSIYREHELLKATGIKGREPRWKENLPLTTNQLCTVIRVTPPTPIFYNNHDHSNGSTAADSPTNEKYLSGSSSIDVLGSKILNWECFHHFCDVFAQFWIGKGPIFGPKIGLGKSLCLYHGNAHSLSVLILALYFDFIFYEFIISFVQSTWKSVTNNTFPPLYNSTHLGQK